MTKTPMDPKPVIYNDLYLNVFQYLLPRDLAQVSLANRNLVAICRDETLWRSMLIYRFGESALNGLESTASFREEYKRRSSLLVTAEQLSIIWLNGQYWRLEDRDESTSGKVAVLRDVWWFDVSCTVRAVPAGRYKVIWRLQLKDSWGLEDLEFNAIVQTEDAVVDGMQTTATSHSLISTKLGNEGLKNVQNKGWIDYVLPELLEVRVPGSSLEFMDVKLEIVDHSNLWKGGITLDSVRLKPLWVDDDLLENEGDDGQTEPNTCTIS